MTASNPVDNQPPFQTLPVMADSAMTSSLNNEITAFSNSYEYQINYETFSKLPDGYMEAQTFPATSDKIVIHNSADKTKEAIANQPPRTSKNPVSVQSQATNQQPRPSTKKVLAGMGSCGAVGAAVGTGIAIFACPGQVAAYVVIGVVGGIGGGGLGQYFCLPK